MKLKQQHWRFIFVALVTLPAWEGCVGSVALPINYHGIMMFHVNWLSSLVYPVYNHVKSDPHIYMYMYNIYIYIHIHIHIMYTQNVHRIYVRIRFVIPFYDHYIFVCSSSDPFGGLLTCVDSPKSSSGKKKQHPIIIALKAIFRGKFHHDLTWRPKTMMVRIIEESYPNGLNSGWCNIVIYPARYVSIILHQLIDGLSHFIRIIYSAS